MNARSLDIADSRSPSGGPQVAGSRSLAHTVRALLVVLACGFAHAQGTLADLVAFDSQRCLQHADPEVRGEAALVVAGSPTPAVQDALLALAADPAPAARHRALVALGLLATPAAVQFLGKVLDDTGTRGEDDGVAAAFGLGLVPSERSTTVSTRILSAIAQSSWKRQRDTLLAMLLAMERQPERTDAVAMRRLFDDDSNRDPEVRGLLLQRLLPNDRTFEDKQLRKLLDRGSEPERLAVLRWLAGERRVLEADWLALLERVAAHGGSPEIRAAALAVLTRARYLPALDLAVRALRDAPPVECSQAMRSLLAIGGASMLRAAAPRIAGERDPARQAAMLAGFEAPLPAELADHCRKLALAPDQPWPLRAAAALALSRSAGGEAAAVLRDTFRATADASVLPALAEAVRSSHDEPVELVRLLDGGTDLRAHPARWVALLLAEHPEAERQVLAGLRAPDRTTSPLPALRAWRLARVLALPRTRAEAAPALLQSLLGT